MQFSVIQQTVKDYILDLPDSTIDLVPFWINKAIEAAEKLHNFRNMERTLEIITVPNQREQVNAPTKYKASRSDPFLIGGDGKVSEIDWAPSRSDMNRRYGNDPDIDIGSPQFILEIFDADEDTTEFHSYPMPDTQSLYDDGDYRLSLPYYAYSDDLVDGTNSNYMTNGAELYVIYRATEYGMLFNRDEQRGLSYRALADSEYKTFKNVDKRKRLQRRNELTISLGANSPSKAPRSRLQFGRR